jgi:hypothetical protein
MPEFAADPRQNKEVLEIAPVLGWFNLRGTSRVFRVILIGTGRIFAPPFEAPETDNALKPRTSRSQAAGDGAPLPAVSQSGPQTVRP